MINCMVANADAYLLLVGSEKGSKGFLKGYRFGEGLS